MNPLESTTFAKEWADSCIDPELAALNFLEVSGDNALNRLLISPTLERRNDGRVAQKYLNRYAAVVNAPCWQTCTLDPKTDWTTELEWGQLKSLNPRSGYNPQTGKEKLIKYEAPPQTETRAFYLKVTPRIWQIIAMNHGMQIPSDIVVTPEGQALGFWRWIYDNNLPVILTEGAKKTASALTAGYIAVGVPGVFNVYRTDRETRIKQLHPDIQKIVTPGRRIYLAFDNDSKPETKYSVSKAIDSMGALFDKAQCEVRIVDWSKYKEKGLDDLIAKQGLEVFYERIQKALSLQLWRCGRYSQLTIIPDLVVNTRYLGKLEIPEDAQIICIKSPKGTGKTETLAHIVSENQYQGIATLVVGHRVQLGQASADRFGIPYVTDLRSKENALGQSLGFALCIDSLHPNSQAKFDPTRWAGATLIFDEAEQIFQHALNSSTCQKERVPILDTLEELVTTVIATGGKIILSDADLTDGAIEFIQNLSKYEGKPWIVVNEWKPEQAWTVTHYEDSTPTQMVMALIEQLKDGRTKHPFICVSGQKKKSRFGTQNMEVLITGLCQEQGVQLLRLDSETVADPSHAGYGAAAHINEIVTQYTMTIASPTLETGVSIDTPHFDSVWGIYQGISTPDSVRQSLARVRQPVPRHIWASKRGIAPIANGETSIRALLASDKALTKQNINLLISAGVTDEFSTEFNPIFLQTWARNACRINMGMVSYRESIIEGLIAEGHTIVKPCDRFTPEAEKDFKDDLTLLATYMQEMECEAVVDTEDITDSEYEKLENQKTKTEEERRKVRKHFLKSRYQVDLDTEIIKKDEDGWYPQLLLHYYLTVGEEFLMPRDKKRAKAQREKGQGKVWSPDFNSTLLSTPVGMLKKLGILDFAAPDRELRNTDQDIIKLAQWVRGRALQIKTGLRIRINERMSGVEICRRLLEKVGIEIKLLKREGKKGHRQRVYKAVIPEDNRNEIFQRWIERDLAEREMEAAIAETARIAEEEARAQAESELVVEDPDVNEETS